MPEISLSMIHPDLRKKARSLGFSNKPYSLFKTKVMKSLCRLLKGRHSRQMRYEQVTVPRPDGSRLRLCVYSPPECRENVPGLVWIHGGGYAIGIPEQDDAYILRFVESSGCVVVSPDYALSVDKPYPAALDDCYAALLWLKEHGEGYGMRRDQIFVGGDSAGGGLAAALSLHARDRKEVDIAFLILLYPMLDDRPTASSTDNNAPVWGSSENDASWRLYLGDLHGTDDIPAYAAPARATDYSNLPPTLAFVGSIEPFVDETVTYMDNLQKAGVPVQFKVYDGCFHAFDQMCSDSDIAREATDFLMQGYNAAVQQYFSPSGGNENEF